LREPTFLQAASLLDRSDLLPGATLRPSATLDAAAAYWAMITMVTSKLMWSLRSQYILVYFNKRKHHEMA
jgi:hypothetical protein